jgi:hypothetical protein
LGHDERRFLKGFKAFTKEDSECIMVIKKKKTVQALKIPNNMNYMEFKKGEKYRNESMDIARY